MLSLQKERHTLEHMLLRCSHAVKFCKEFYSWWSQITKENITLPDRTLLYGPVQPGKHQLVLSSALLIANYFIYKCSLTEELLLFELFKLQFYDHGMTERYLAIKNRSGSTFSDKWQPFIVSNFIPSLQ